MALHSPRGTPQNPPYGPLAVPDVQRVRSRNHPPATPSHSAGAGSATHQEHRERLDKRRSPNRSLCAVRGSVSTFLCSLGPVPPDTLAVMARDGGGPLLPHGSCMISLLGPPITQRRRLHERLHHLAPGPPPDAGQDLAIPPISLTFTLIGPAITTISQQLTPVGARVTRLAGVVAPLRRAVIEVPDPFANLPGSVTRHSLVLPHLKLIRRKRRVGGVAERHPHVGHMVTPVRNTLTHIGKAPTSVDHQPELIRAPAPAVPHADQYLTDALQAAPTLKPYARRPEHAYEHHSPSGLFVRPAGTSPKHT